MITLPTCKKIIVNIVNKLEQNEENLNKLNVFPIPDGDTGSNILLTFIGGLKAVSEIDSDSIRNFFSKFAKGLVSNSRGNSGTIISQYFRGFYSEMVDVDKSLSTSELMSYLKTAYKYAYASIGEPKRGTVLSVMESVYKVPEDNIYDFTKQLYTIACETLIDGVNQLQVLQETGVVDSGGYAFLFFFEELYIALSLDIYDDKLKYIAYWKDKISSFTPEKSYKYTEWKNGIVRRVNEKNNLNFLDYTFCTEFILKPNCSIEKDDMYHKLSNLGNSIVIIDDEKGFKIHIHTNVPEKIITMFENIGSIFDLKIDNMYFQHQHYINDTDITSKSRINKNIGTLSIVSSEGLANLMYSIGVDRVIVTSPTLTELISQAGEINAQNIIVLPSDDKLFSVINEAISVSHKNINLIESKSIPEIISSMIQFDSDKDLSENLRNMSLALNKVKYAEIIDVGRLNNGVYNNFKDYSFIGVSSQRVLSYGDSKNQVLKEAIDNLIDDNISLITIFSGKNHSEDELTRLKILLENTYKKVNIEIIDTKQPESYFIVSLE